MVYGRLLLLGAVLASAGAATLTTAAGSGGHVVASPGRPAGGPGMAYRLPITGPERVIRRYEPPPGPYGPGHRGVDLDVGTSRTVHAAQAGRVRFAGQVAGRGVVVVVHPDGIRTEYEPVTPAVRTGDVVARGAVLGAVAGRHGAFPPDRCLHWGAERNGAYFDPMSLLATLGTVRLVPWSDR